VEDLIIGSALEWWLASGPRTRARLIDLVGHYADTYGYAGDRGALAEMAWRQARVRTGHCRVDPEIGD
jgi:hypothetical protein